MEMGGKRGIKNSQKQWSCQTKLNSEVLISFSVTETCDGRVIHTTRPPLKDPTHTIRLQLQRKASRKYMAGMTNKSNSAAETVENKQNKKNPTTVFRGRAVPAELRRGGQNGVCSGAQFTAGLTAGHLPVWHPSTPQRRKTEIKNPKTKQRKTLQETELMRGEPARSSSPTHSRDLKMRLDWQ